MTPAQFHAISTAVGFAVDHTDVTDSLSDAGYSAEIDSVDASKFRIGLGKFAVSGATDDGEILATFQLVSVEIDGVVHTAETVSAKETGS